jgi:hypothetical protein
MIIDAAIWLQNLAPFTYIRDSLLVYPAILSLHLVFMALFGASIVLTDLRLLGWAMTDFPVPDVIGRLRNVKRVGFVLAATCGFLLFASKAEVYCQNPFFQAKAFLLGLVAVHAAAFRARVYQKAAGLDPTQIPRQARLAAILSLCLWFGILCAGRGIGYLTPPNGLHFAQLFAGSLLQ